MDETIRDKIRAPIPPLVLLISGKGLEVREYLYPLNLRLIYSITYIQGLCIIYELFTIDLSDDIIISPLLYLFNVVRKGFGNQRPLVRVQM